MRTQFQKTLNEFDLRLTEVCAATHLDTALEKQREIIRLLDNFANIIHEEKISKDELIEINHVLKDILNDCIRNRNHIGQFDDVYEEQSDEIIDQISSIINRISRVLRRQLPHQN